VADSDVAALSDALEQRVRRKLVRQPNRATVFLNLINKQFGSGKNCAFDVSVGTADGQNFDDGEAVSTWNNDTELMAILAWAIYGDAFRITGLAESIAAGEPTELARLYIKKLIDAGGRTASKLNKALYSGTGGTSPQQLHGVSSGTGPMSDSGSYAGIDRSSHVQWAATVSDNGAVDRNLTVGVIEDHLEAMYVASGRQPHYILTTPTLWSAYARLVAPEKRYLQEVTIRGETIKLDGGWRALEINGIPIFKDKDCTAKEMVFVDDDHLVLEQLPDPEVLKGRAIASIPIAGTPQEQAGTIPDRPGLMARVIELGRAGDMTPFQMIVHTQLTSDRCNAHGRLTDLIP
jgi:hypothetical protein